MGYMVVYNCHLLNRCADARHFPLRSYPREAVRTILGVGVLKVVENIFEHNEGIVFGQSKTEDDPADEGGDEGGVG